MGPGWVRWMVTWWESENGCELGLSDGLFPGNLQIDPGFTKWTVFWSETFLIKPGLVNWTEFCVECPIGGERGGVEGFS